MALYYIAVRDVNLNCTTKLKSNRQRNLKHVL